MSEGARKTAAVVLEVMAGTIKPSDAADVLGITTVSYYNLEARALQGMVRACEPARKGPAINLKKKIQELEEENRRLERESMRYQTLTRVAQRAIGLSIETEKKEDTVGGNGNGGKKRKSRRPSVRALRAARRLREGTKSRKKPAKV